MHTATNSQQSESWNKGSFVGQKAPLKLNDIRAIRVRLRLAGTSTRVSDVQVGRAGSNSPSGISRRSCLCRADSNPKCNTLVSVDEG
jgi:hypothetical protein